MTQRVTKSRKDFSLVFLFATILLRSQPHEPSRSLLEPRPSSKTGLASSPKRVFKSFRHTSRLLRFQTTSNKKTFSNANMLQPTKPFLQQKYYFCYFKGFFSHEILYVERKRVAKTKNDRNLEEKSITESSWARKSGGKSNLYQLSSQRWSSDTHGEGAGLPSTFKHCSTPNSGRLTTKDKCQRPFY